MLALAIALISLALLAYTAGVWAEHRTGRLQPWHVATFAVGLAFDATGTWVMSRLAGQGATTGHPMSSSVLGSALGSVMAVTGAAALGLMAAHLGWALVVLRRGRPHELTAFHKLNLNI
jgi:uncharacterized repeat protein (TIGR03987 family)